MVTVVTDDGNNAKTNNTVTTTNSDFKYPVNNLPLLHSDLYPCHSRVLVIAGGINAVIIANIYRYYETSIPATAQ